MVANFLADLVLREAAACFNQAIQCLARFGVFPREVTLVLDGTDVETTGRCRGAGRAKREKKVTDRAGRPKVVEVLVFGFKVVVAFDLATQIPVADIVVKIQRHETLCTRRLVRQAQSNLSPGGARVAKVLVDRGCLDGATLHWLDQQGIAFVVPAKKKMLVHRLACSEAQGKKGHVQSRTRTVTHGHGKHKMEAEASSPLEALAPGSSRPRPSRRTPPSPCHAPVPPLPAFLLPAALLCQNPRISSAVKVCASRCRTLCIPPDAGTAGHLLNLDRSHIRAGSASPGTTHRKPTSCAPLPSRPAHASCYRPAYSPPTPPFPASPSARRTCGSRTIHTWSVRDWG
ncbi:transposase [Limnochorda pilosa]